MPVPAIPQLFSTMRLFTQSWNSRHTRTVLAILALFTLIIALFHLNGDVPTIRSRIHSTINSIKSQDPESWYKALIPQSQYCKWEFSHYEPSPYEEKWFSIINESQNHICETVYEPEHAENSQKIVRRIENLLRIDTKIHCKQLWVFLHILLNPLGFILCTPFYSIRSPQKEITLPRP